MGLPDNEKKLTAPQYLSSQDKFNKTEFQQINRSVGETEKIFNTRGKRLKLIEMLI